MKAHTFYHGTDEESAMAIMKQGIRPQNMDRGDEAPGLQGRSYFSNSVYQALQYAAHRGMWNDHSIYIFAIPGSELRDVLLDEDILFRISEEGVDRTSWQKNFVIDEGLSPLPVKWDKSPVVKKIREWLYNNAGENPDTEDFRDCSDRLPDELVGEFLSSFYSGFSSSGEVIWPSEVYVLTVKDAYKRQVEELPMDPGGLKQFWNMCDVKVVPLKQK
jgi:hypothetical protein